MPDSIRQRKSISLFSGAGGMDVGFARAGFESLLACELDGDACQTLNLNLQMVGHVNKRIVSSSITDIDLTSLPPNVDVIYGGPPCQGFSVAGKMNPNDERSQLIYSFFDVVDSAQPKGFVCENVKALAVSDRWEEVRERIMARARIGYRVALIVLNATEFGVPQVRERMFIFGIRRDIFKGNDKTLDVELRHKLSAHHRRAPSVAEVIRNLGKAGTNENPRTCSAKITYAKTPILRKSPYAGMMFNGAGRPLRTRGYSTTLPASMGGNRTPIIDEDEVFLGKDSFIKKYHDSLLKGIKPLSGEAPPQLRRLTISESMAIQTFPENYKFFGKKSSIYRQIGNAVPCDLAEAVAKSYIDLLSLHESALVNRTAA